MDPRNACLPTDKLFARPKTILPCDLVCYWTKQSFSSHHDDVRLDGYNEIVRHIAPPCVRVQLI